MPRNKRCWTSWNFLGDSGAGADDKAVCVTYWLNRLQNLPPSAPPLFVTLNPLHPPRYAEEHRTREQGLRERARLSLALANETPLVSPDVTSQA